MLNVGQILSYVNFDLCLDSVWESWHLIYHLEVGLAVRVTDRLWCAVHSNFNPPGFIVDGGGATCILILFFEETKQKKAVPVHMASVNLHPVQVVRHFFNIEGHRTSSQVCFIHRGVVDKLIVFTRVRANLFEGFKV